MVSTPYRIEVSVAGQQLLVRNAVGEVIYCLPVSTGLAGTGCEPDSGRTPLGQFEVCQVIGQGEPPDTIFSGRVPVGAYPHAVPQGMPQDADFILTRLFWLAGLEPHNANTRERYIYIHGTNRTDLLGQPVSFGCVRVSQQDAILLEQCIQVGTQVEIV